MAYRTYPITKGNYMKKQTINSFFVILILISVLIVALLCGINLYSSLHRIDDLHAVLYFWSMIFFVAGSLFVAILEIVIWRSVIFFFGYSEKKTWISVSFHVSFILFAFFLVLLLVLDLENIYIHDVKLFYYHFPLLSLEILIPSLIVYRLLYFIVVQIIRAIKTRKNGQTEVVAVNSALKYNKNQYELPLIILFNGMVTCILLLTVCFADYYTHLKPVGSLLPYEPDNLRFAIYTKNIIPLIVILIFNFILFLIFILINKRKRKQSEVKVN